MDERVPIRKESGKLILAVNAATEVTADYCPFCGEGLNGGSRTNSPSAGVCDHVEELAAKPGSCVRYVADQREYFIFGTGDLRVCLFFCPVCGRKMPLHETKRCQKSGSEVARLERLVAGIKSIEQAIEKLGRPDAEDGPVSDHFYWKAERLPVGYRRCLCYKRLAKSVDVQVVEWSDGKLDVKFLAKALEGEGGEGS